MDEAITQKLFALQDETYQAFQSKLMPHRIPGNDHRRAHTAAAEACKGALRNGPGGSLSAQSAPQILRGE